MHETNASIEKVIPKHANFDLVEQLQNAEEEVRLEAERVAKILEYFTVKSTQVKKWRNSFDWLGTSHRCVLGDFWS